MDAADALRAALSTDNEWIKWSTLAVFVGVIVELADLLLFNKEMTKLQRRILFIATFLIAAGCGGEWYFEDQAAQAEGQLQRLSDEKVAALTRDEAADNRIATLAAARAAQIGIRADAAERSANKADVLAKDAKATITPLAGQEQTLQAVLGRDETRLAEAEKQTWRRVNHFNPGTLMVSLQSTETVPLYIVDVGDADFTRLLEVGLIRTHVPATPAIFSNNGVSLWPDGINIFLFGYRENSTKLKLAANALCRNFAENGLDVNEPVVLGVKAGRGIDKVSWHIWPQGVPTDALLIIVGRTQGVPDPTLKSGEICSDFVKKDVDP
jgi:hypothetical protein